MSTLSRMTANCNKTPLHQPIFHIIQGWFYVGKPLGESRDGLLESTAWRTTFLPSSQQQPTSNQNCTITTPKWIFVRIKITPIIAGWVCAVLPLGEIRTSLLDHITTLHSTQRQPMSTISCITANCNKFYRTRRSPTSYFRDQ